MIGQSSKSVLPHGRQTAPEHSPKHTADILWGRLFNSAQMSHTSYCWSDVIQPRSKQSAAATGTVNECISLSIEERCQAQSILPVLHMLLRLVAGKASQLA